MSEEVKKPAEEAENTAAVVDNEPEVKSEANKEKKKKEKKTKDKEELDKLREEFETYKQTHLRTLAEYDNFRKRTNNEKAQIYGGAVSDTINALLPVADNMERALAQENATAEDMRKGVEMIANQFSASFDKLGITAIGTVGEKFNPELHNAVSHIDSDDLEENVIATIFQKGYKLGDKVIRHAMVQVAN